MLRRLLPALAGVLILLACSGPTSPGAPGGEPSSAPVSDAARTDAIGAVEAELADLMRRLPQSYQEDLAGFIAARPEFAWASVQDTGGVLAFFTDGRALIVPAPRISSGAAQAPSFEPGLEAWPEVGAADPLGWPEQTGAPGITPNAAGLAPQQVAGELPESRDAVLVEAMGPLHASALDAVTDSLRHAGYAANVLSGDVQSLRALPHAGVLYYSGHGGPFVKAELVDGGVSLQDRLGAGADGARGLRPPPRPKQPVAAHDDFALWTAEPRSTEADAAHQADLDAGRLVYMTATFASDGAPATHYAITTSFITSYWSGKLGKHSLAYIDSCFGGSAILGTALKEAGASAHAGWSTAVSDQATVLRLTPYFFDRATGHNAFEPATPANPPFEVAKVLEAVGAKGYDRDAAFPSATFGVTTLQDAFGMLTPRAMLTIDNFHEGKDHVYLLGQFGSVPGAVTVGGSEVTITEWTPTNVYLDFPSSLAGDVVVEVGGRRSNARRLTSWLLPVEIENRGSGSLTLRMDCTLHLRGDLLPWNPYAPDHPLYLEEMAKPYASVTGKEPSTCTYAASGSYTTPGPYPVTTTFSGGGTMAKTTTTTGAPDLMDYMAVDPGHAGGILGTAFPEDRHAFTRTTGGDAYVEDLLSWMGEDCNRFGFESLELDASYAIQAGSDNYPREVGGCHASWGAATAAHPPGE